MFVCFTFVLNFIYSKQLILLNYELSYKAWVFDILGGKACQVQTLCFLQFFCQLLTKKFYKIDPTDRISNGWPNWTSHWRQLAWPNLRKSTNWRRKRILKTKKSSKVFFRLKLWFLSQSLLQCCQLKWRHNIRHNDIHHNDTKHNYIQHNGIQHNDTQHNYIQHNRK